MATITLTRTDVTTEDVAAALRAGLGSKYHVLPNTALNWNPLGRPRPDHPDTIVVGTGSTKLLRAQVKISRGPAKTTLHVSPGGLTPPFRLTNRFGIDRKVLQVLHAAPNLR